MAGEPLRSPSHRVSFSDEERPYIPFRHVRPAPAGYPASSESSVSSASSIDEGPPDHIDPEDSASRDRPPRSHVSVRSHHSVRTPAPHHAGSALSHVSSHRGAPLPPQSRPDHRDEGHYRTVERVRSISRERRARHDAPQYPVHEDHRRPHPPGREGSGSSLDSSESSSLEGHMPGRPYYDPHYGPPQHVGYPPQHQPYPMPRRPSYNNYPPEYAAPHAGALMHMPPPDPYYRDRRDRYGHSPFAMSPPPDPYYPEVRHHRPHHPPRPTSYHDPHYAEAMVPAAYHHPHHHHQYYQQPPGPQVNYISPPSQAPPPPVKSPAPPTPKEDDPELKRLQQELAMIKEAQIRDEERQRQEERERKIRLEAELAALQKLKADQEAEKKRKEEMTAVEKAAREKVEQEMKEKAAKTQAENDKKAAEEKKKLEDLEKKKKELEEDIKKAKGDPDSKKAPVRLKDSVLERKFDFPWGLAKKWSDTLKLLEQAYESVPDLHRRILENRFELVGPDRQIILPSVWETTIQPGWEVTLLMPPDPTPQHGPMLEQMMAGMYMDSKPKKHKSSKDKKSSSKDKDRKKSSSSKRGPEIVSFPGGEGLPMAPSAGLPPGMFGAVGGSGTMPVPPMGDMGMEYFDPMKLEKDERHKKKKSERRGTASGGGGLFGFGGGRRK
ncbi:Tuberous sclerosis 1 [Elsinoe australis]|uniref:Tuberous sclerosis 1 n=1 Tax=Elsinoe australis TaxID=40998 RepID=A0A2P7Z676_9PEZI|nr:Tuberous sclerosis 1 [Elsinoe australis]